MKKIGFIEKYLKYRISINEPDVHYQRDKDSRYLNFNGGVVSMNATGSTNSNGVDASHPYVITISNSSASAVANFILFNANTNIYLNDNKTAAYFQNGNYIQGSVTATSGLNGVSFQSLVSQSQTQPFTIGSTAITTTVNHAQLQQPITVSTIDASGLNQGVPIIFLKDPYQRQRDILICNTPFTIDGTTAMTIANILPNAVFSIFLYPAMNINPASQLSAESTKINYANANLIRVLPVSTGVM